MSDLLKGGLGFKGNKGDTGEIGTPISYMGSFEELKNSTEDKYHNYIIMDDADTEYVGHWVYYDRYSSEWKDGGPYLAQGLTKEVEERLENVENTTENTEERQDNLERQFDEQIKNMTLESPNDAEIVQARGNFETLEKRLNNSDGVKADKTQLQQIDSNLQRQIDSLASGSPKGSYATVVDLITDNPATGVYVIQEDGHVYGWTKDEENAIDLGVYQATEIAEESIEPIKTTFFDKSKNLIYKWIKGKALMSSTGIEYNNPIGCTSNYFEIDASKFISFIINQLRANYAYSIFYFDENKAFISREGFTSRFTTNNVVGITPVENSKYARLQILNNTSGASSCIPPEYWMISIVDNLYSPEAYVAPEMYSEELTMEKEIDIAKLSNSLRNIFEGQGNEMQLTLITGSFKSYRTDENVESSEYSNATIDVSEGEIYKITGYSYFQGKLYYMYNSKNMLVDYYPKTYGGTRKDTVYVKIPKDVTRMVINSLDASPTSVIKIEQFVIKSILNGKLLAVNGDSLCEGNANAGISFADLIANKYGMTLDKTAVGGATIATGTVWQDSSPRHYISTSVSSMSANADYVLIGGGVNDYWQKVPLGNITERMSSTVNTDTFYGALEQMCRNLLSRYIGKKIGFIIYHKIGRIYKTTNSIGFTYTDYYNAIIEVLNKYSIPYIDLSKTSCFNTELSYYQENYTCNQDGTHPTTEGYELFYNDKIAKWMESL